MKVDLVLKRTVSVFLSICLLLAMTPIRALAAGDCICTDKCSFSAPNSGCPHCSTAEEGSFACRGTYASNVTGTLSRTYGDGLEGNFYLNVTGGSGQLTLTGDQQYTISVSGGSTALRWSDVLSAERNAGTHSLNYSFTPSSGDYRPSSGKLTFQVLPKSVTAAVQLSHTEYVYDGVPKTPSVTATAEGRTLAEGVDYTVTYQQNNAPGTGKAVLQDVPGDNYIVSGEASFTILFGPVDLGAVTYTGGKLLDSMSPGDVVLTRQNTSVPGVLTLSAMKLTAGTHDYTWTFTPTDRGYETKSGTVTLTVEHDWTKGSCTEAPTCRGCGETNGTAPGHTLSYSAAGAVITEKCSTAGFEHTGTVKLELVSGASTEYTGSEIKPLKITYSESWTGPRNLTVTYENNVNIGTASGSVTVGGATAKLNFEIAPVTMKVTASDVSCTYDGKPHSASVSIPQGAAIRFGTKSGSYALTECPAYTDAGDYTVYYQVTKENHKTLEGTLRIRIAPVAVTVTVQNAEKIYGEGEPAPFSWKITSGKTVDGESLGNITLTRDSGEDAGSYAITATDGGHNKNYAITFVPGTFTIRQREITISWSDLELTYNGTEQAPKATAGNAAFGDKLELTVSGGRTDATGGQKVTAKVTGITGPKAANYKLPANVSAQFEIKKATMEEPKLRYTDETVDGKHDGAILGVTPDMEYRREDQQSYTRITGTKVENLAPGKYYIRYAESNNCYVSQDAQLVIGGGEKLKITLPEQQVGYTLTAEPAEVSYGGTVVLTFSLVEGSQKTEDFALKVNGQAVTLRPDGKCELKDIKENLTVTVEGVSDGEPPEVTLRLGNRTWNSFRSGIGFSLIYNSAQTVTITAEDKGSGVDTIHYHLAFRELTYEQLKSVYDWTKYTASFTIRPDNKYVIYVRVVDKTGNETYINSDGLIFDELSPTVTGVRNRGIYYTTQKAEATDNFRLSTFKMDGSTFDGLISGNPEVETKHTLTAWDAAGNSTTVTVTMMPISSLGEKLPQEETLTLADREAILELKEQIRKILDKESEHATVREKQELEALEKRCDDLLEILEPVQEVQKLLEALPDTLTVTPDERKYIDMLDAAQEAYDALTQKEKGMLGNSLDRLNALRKAMTAYYIVEGNKGKWTAGDTKGLTIVGNGYYAALDSYAKGAYGKFLGVLVDGQLLDEEHYSVRSGSTVVTLKTSYLETLESGKHTIRLRYTDGETEEGTFRISQSIGVSSGAGAMNIIGILFWAALGLACLVGIILVVLLILWKKEKE